jgi:hypothetical protein
LFGYNQYGIGHFRIRPCCELLPVVLNFCYAALFPASSAGVVRVEVGDSASARSLTITAATCSAARSLPASPATVRTAPLNPSAKVHQIQNLLPERMPTQIHTPVMPLLIAEC